MGVPLLGVVQENVDVVPLRDRVVQLFERPHKDGMVFEKYEGWSDDFKGHNVLLRSLGFSEWVRPINADEFDVVVFAGLDADLSVEVCVAEPVSVSIPGGNVIGETSGEGVGEAVGGG